MISRRHPKRGDFMFGAGKVREAVPHDTGENSGKEE